MIIARHLLIKLSALFEYKKKNIEPKKKKISNGQLCAPEIHLIHYIHSSISDHTHLIVRAHRTAARRRIQKTIHNIKWLGTRPYTPTKLYFATIFILY